MPLTRPTNKDLVEIFGYAPDDLTPSVRSLWNLGACPFINKACVKSNHDSSVVYGTCSVTSAFGDCIICPNRLYERDYATLRAVAEDAFGKNAKFVLFDEHTTTAANRRRAYVEAEMRVTAGVSEGREWTPTGHAACPWRVRGQAW